MSAGISAGAIAGGLAAGVGGSLVSGLLSPGTSGGSGGGGASYYIPTGLNSADTTWQNLLNNITADWNFNNGNLSQYGTQSLQSGLAANSIYGPGYQNAANTAGNQYGYLGTLMNYEGTQNLNAQNALMGAGRQVFDMGLDPQSALYNRTQQRVQDQTNANNSMYGLGSSAAGAGLANQAMSNFNIDWQNNQLQRAAQGLQAYSGAANTAGRFGELGTSQLQSAPGYTLAGGSTPYTTAQTIAGVPGSLASTYGSYLNSNVYGPAEGIMNQVIPYMNYGQGAQQVPFQSQAQAAGAAGSLVSRGIQGLFGNQPSYAGDFSTSSPFSSSGFYDPTLYGPSGYGGSYGYGGGGNSYGFTV